MQQDQWHLLIDFNLIAAKVFKEEEGQLLIGGIQIDKQLRDSLREEAKLITQMRFWEVLHATIIQEASDMALIQSKDMDHVNIAKMLKHWGYVFQNMVYRLSKE